MTCLELSGWGRRQALTVDPRCQTSASGAERRCVTSSTSWDQRSARLVIATTQAKLDSVHPDLVIFAMALARLTREN